ncbi:hypothetical protein [Labrenzia sp. OB1]|uniref:hypothetical protein n=1 Tax=Labrenzia sp. OB1 TaxID=1561204 RepID=UPI0007B2A4AC|nr:hypothetical protein [Labrenzia sp. OB1]KZM50374.1 hypothetical protein OA90_10815 [Labrenzia sp. OB1]
MKVILSNFAKTLSRQMATCICAAGITLAAAGPLNALELIGKTSVKLTTASAFLENGSRAPDKDDACTERYEADLGTVVNIEFGINVTTLIMLAEAEVQGIAVELHPLGISGTYSFMSDGLPESLREKGFMREIFSVKTDFSNETFDLMGELDENTNCVLSNLRLSDRR